MNKKKKIELKIMISEGWQETSFVTSCCDSPSFSTASGDLLSDYNFFISRWLHRSCFRLENRINLFSVSFFWFWLLCWNWFGILTFSMNFMPLSLLYACCQDCVCKKAQMHCWGMSVSQWLRGNSIMKRNMTFP